MAGALEGQVAIVTGGGGGFGRAIAVRFAAEGAAVTVTSRTKAALDETVAQIQSAGGRALAVAGDVTSRADVARVVQETERQFGPVTIMVNNAGVPGPFGPIGVMDPDEWWAAQAVHIRAPFLFMSAVLPGMKERRRGCIITIASPRAKMTSPNLSAYCMGKTAQARLTQLVAAEVKDYGITAFAVDPGTTPTQLADKTIDSPDAQRWIPDMVEKLRSMRGQPGGELILARCAQRCVELAAGKHDELSGAYIGRNDVADPWQ
ncbi:MAG: SDR family oxidoreductase [Candidatus Acidiferrales bacterium]|jgi:NAD(P)-dependent dehydrogenase (short-subunit alcohol dehydrogenase family)